MDRLQTELQRLYFLHDGPQGATRALALELSGPARWAVLREVWQGVQADLEMPAPAIAVSGIDGLQLWFSFSQPLALSQATDFLGALRRRYMGDVAQDRVRLKPAGALGADFDSCAAAPPLTEVAPGRWSAFIAPDLAALFENEPWLDMPPGAEAQADLLSRIKTTQPAELERALERLRPTKAHPPLEAAASHVQHVDPRRFLLEVMNDPAIDMRLRIEAAKALVPYSLATLRTQDPP